MKTYTSIRTGKQQGFIIPLLLIAIGMFLGWKAFGTIKATAPDKTTPTTTSIETASSSDEVSTTWKTASVPGNLASFKYPSDWRLSGRTLSNAQGDIVIKGSYGKGMTVECDPLKCTKVSINGITYNRTEDVTSAGTKLTYSVSMFGYGAIATTLIPANRNKSVNIKLIDKIVGTIKIK